MTAEQFLQNLDLSDDLIRESDPADFCRNASRRLRQILTFGGLAAALVLCFTVGLTRFFSPTPGGSPSVQLPPVVATDTQTAITDTNSSTEDYANQPSACPPPHFHYHGIIYSVNGKLMLSDHIPEEFSYIGDGILHMGCISGLEPHGEEDLCGNIIGPVYFNVEKTEAYIIYGVNESGIQMYQKLEIERIDN